MPAPIIKASTVTFCDKFVSFSTNPYVCLPAASRPAKVIDCGEYKPYLFKAYPAKGTLNGPTAPMSISTRLRRLVARAVSIAGRNAAPRVTG